MKKIAVLRAESPFYGLFKGGAVPIINIHVPSSATLEGSDETAVYMVDVKELTPSQLGGICNILMAASGVAAGTIFLEITERGLPLRLSQVEAVWTDVPFFL
jgi:hypothetical protein